MGKHRKHVNSLPEAVICVEYMTAQGGDGFSGQASTDARALNSLYAPAVKEQSTKLEKTLPAHVRSEVRAIPVADPSARALLPLG